MTQVFKLFVKRYTGDHRSIRGLLCLLVGLLYSGFGFGEADRPGYENQFYVMDFSANSYTIKDVEKRFFTSFPHSDPTRGDVVYDQSKWINDDMIEVLGRDALYLRIKDREDERMFDSVRMTSKAYYNVTEQTPRILFVYKGRLPSANGVWPAWWLNGGAEDEWLYNAHENMPVDKDLAAYTDKGPFYMVPSPVNTTDWPSSGELDIIETINGHKLVHNTLHTCPQMYGSRWNKSSDLINCANPKGEDPNSGCSGKPYEVAKMEGTFAAIWEKDSIEFYYWSDSERVRASGGPLSANPNPASWQASQLKNRVDLVSPGTQCEAEKHQPWQCQKCEGSASNGFRNMKMVFNTTVCGIWAGVKFDGTPDAVSHCQDYVFSEGKKRIDNEYIKVEYISVSAIQ